MSEMIALIKNQILGYAAKKRTLEGLSEITRDVTHSLANVFNLSPDATHPIAVKMVRQALAELGQEYK